MDPNIVFPHRRDHFYSIPRALAAVLSIGLGLGVGPSVVFPSGALSGTDAVRTSDASMAQAADRPVGKGVFLVADPRLNDPNFSRTVVLITHHGRNGSVGVILNRPTDTLLRDDLPEYAPLHGAAEPLYEGGPVMRRVRSVLVQIDHPPSSAELIFGDIYFDAADRLLPHLLAEEDPSIRLRVFSGYAGWAPGQLQGEIHRLDWRVLPAEADAVFQRGTDRLWEEMLRRSTQQWVRGRTGFPKNALRSR